MRFKFRDYLQLEVYHYNFQFSLWDSKMKCGSVSWTVAVNSFNSLYEILLDVTVDQTILYTFNSLYEIPCAACRAWIYAARSFQFSLWDSSGAGVWTSVQSSISFNSLYEILDLENVKRIQLKFDFQFSLWDSPAVIPYVSSLPRHLSILSMRFHDLFRRRSFLVSATFQFSLWDSHSLGGYSAGWIIHPFNSLYEILAWR